MAGTCQELSHEFKGQGRVGTVATEKQDVAGMQCYLDLWALDVCPPTQQLDGHRLGASTDRTRFSWSQGQDPGPDRCRHAG